LIKSVLEFGLTRSAIIVLGLVVFCSAGLVAFTKLNIEAYPNPAPVILEITAQAAGLSAEEMENTTPSRWKSGSTRHPVWSTSARRRSMACRSFR
jgi:Cu/Ag efflux pump CusA